MEDAKVRYRWRITTKSRTTDELGMLLLELFRFRSIDPTDITGVCILCRTLRIVRDRKGFTSLFEARSVCHHQRHQNRHANLHGQSLSRLEQTVLSTPSPVTEGIRNLWWSLILGPQRHSTVSMLKAITWVDQSLRGFRFLWMRCLSKRQNCQRWKWSGQIL